MERTFDCVLERVQYQGQTALTALNWPGLKNIQALKATNFLYGPMMIFTKLSILLLYFRLFSANQKFRIWIYIGIITTLLNHVVGTVLAITLCIPSDPLKYAACSHRLNALDVVISVINIISDFYILFLPLLVISTLRMRRNKKIGVGAVFCTGFLYRVLL